MASDIRGTIYIGVTSDLLQRTWQHKYLNSDGFTSRYKVNRLVWYEQHETMDSAIQREKNLKDWNRVWKIELIEKRNPEWKDLYDEL